MKKKNADTLKTILLLFAIVIVTRLIESLPWWIFTVPVLALGMFITVRKWTVNTFWTGFLCGFVLWLGANLYFHLSYNGNILNRIGEGPKVLLLVFSGLIGGLLVGLALYTGRAIAFDKKANLQLPD